MSICDVDGGTESVESVTISYRGRTFIVDLCANETPIIEGWEEAGSGSPRRGTDRPKPPTPPTHSVTPID